MSNSELWVIWPRQRFLNWGSFCAGALLIIILSALFLSHESYNKIVHIDGLAYISGLTPFECQEFISYSVWLLTTYHLILYRIYLCESYLPLEGGKHVVHIFSIFTILKFGAYKKLFSVSTYWVRNSLYNNILSTLYHNMRETSAKIFVADLTTDFIPSAGRDS